jgi:hypothetical protein
MRHERRMRMGLHSVRFRAASLAPLACLLAACGLLASPAPTNPPFDVSVADGLTPRMAPADVVAVARAYLDAQTPELAVPDMHTPAAITAIRAVSAADAIRFDPCIPAEPGAEIVWVTFGRGDYLNLGPYPWSSPFMPDGGRCQMPSSGGTIVIDDATGTILGVFPGNHALVPIPTGLDNTG